MHVETVPCERCEGKGTMPSGLWAKAERKEAGVSQAVLADKLGISRSRVADLETGGRQLTWQQLRDIQAALRELKG
jgi:transcriptional regulator with XRE-family HTH domain